MWNYMAQGMYPYDMLSLGLGMMFLMFVIGIAVYVYGALALMTIATKLQHPYPWLAWIPFANFALILQLGGFHWGWIFLVLIPILGWIALAVLGIVSISRFTWIYSFFGISCRNRTICHLRSCCLERSAGKKSSI